MKIKEIDSEIRKIPLKTPFITALRRVENVEFVRVSVVCDDGRVSYGEAPATKAITGEDLESITKAIVSHRELFYGKSPSESLVLLHQLPMGSSAKAALDMAFYAFLDAQLFDVIKREGEQRCKQTAITISLNKKEKMLFDAQEAVTRGQKILKLKFGSDIEHAMDVTRDIQEQLQDVTILVDANQAWSLEDSKYFLDAFEGSNIDLVEQPLPADALQGLKELKEYSNIPIVADESCFNLEDVKDVVQSASADIINIKLMKCGGVTKAIEILEYCREQEVSVMFGSMLEGPLSIAYAYYLVERFGDIVKYVDLDSPLLYAVGWQ